MTNYEKYFGTPERAAWTMRIHATCDRCPAARHCDIERVEGVSRVFQCHGIICEWLESEADHG